MTNKTDDTPTTPELTEAEKALQIKQARLAEAEEAYHRLQTGVSARVVVDSNGERIEFTAANRRYLISYIQQLRFECDPNSQARPRGICIQNRPGVFSGLRNR